MNSSSKRIVFMGTPAFAVPSLAALLDAGHTIAGVVTAPDKPAGRGMQLTLPPVKRFAEDKGLTVLQPDNLKDEDFIEDLQALNGDLFVVVALRMLPEVVFSMPPMGTINLHASLLPNYRGAAPINRVLMNNEPVTGVTTFFIQKDIDTGPILKQAPLEITPNMLAGELHNQLMHLGANVLVQTVNDLLNGTSTSIPQQDLIKPGEILKTAPKINREDSLINWEDAAEKIHHQVRGLSPQPGASTLFLSESGHSFGVKILETELDKTAQWGTPGEVLLEKPNKLWIQTGSGSLRVKKLQQSGKKIMVIAEFLRGFREQIISAG
ncbi:MAG: methionyl-tRNA formyltransferase [Bacteroidales bacterium]|nr:methionyl-tRNA formyltransferase [Bacteroidales bacterium]